MDEQLRPLILFFAKDSFIQDQLIWCRLPPPAQPNCSVLFLPKNLVPDVLQEIHQHDLNHPGRMLQAREWALQDYYWMGMDTDITHHLCHCRPSTTKGPLHRGLNLDLGNTTEHNQLLHMDIFGLVLAANNWNTFIMCFMDAHTRYTQLASLTDGTPETSNIGFACSECPSKSQSTRTTEFEPPFSKQIQQRMPRTHIQILEHDSMANPNLTKLLATLIDETSVNWTPYLYPLMFNYNTSFHLNDQPPPFTMLFQFPPWNPNFTTKTVPYVQTLVTELWDQFATTQELTHCQPEIQPAELTITPSIQKYRTGQLVLFNKKGRIPNLEPHWTGPHKFTCNKGAEHAELLCQPSYSKIFVHQNDIKPGPDLPPTVPNPTPDLPISKARRDKSH